MKYDRIDNSLYIQNRKNFSSRMESRALAVFNSNDIITTSADSTRSFKQHTDILWLSGVDQEESILVLFPECHNPNHRELLFLKETNEHIAIWEGEKLDKTAAIATSGIQKIYWLDQFETIFNQLMSEAEHVYINTNEHWRANTEAQTREDRWIEWCMEKYPVHNYLRSNPFLHELRAVKHSIEIDLMQKACDITEKGVRRILPFIKPGVMEYEIEAELWHEFIRNRSQGFAYTPILGSGRNACVLHYIENNQECKDGDVILMDFGAEYANYASDLTRSVPVNGRFTKRQRAVYDAVLRVKNGAIEVLRPGKTLKQYHVEVGSLMEKELVDLNLITMDDIKNQNPEWPAYKKYFMHGTSHYIGLDTHDYGPWNAPIPAGSAFTVEPGIYILEENLGIRLEDDYIITDSGHKNLMENIPIEAEEIEDLMNA
ncbi:MAG: M24 family metallopeptidase [Flavobacteriales bacterium]|jgi:Xaa-Pro aminopeptidase|nr:M24 family metallopeptidase [Flavobacteriales bacterium]NCG30912.1 M24 family metallopeptidase [Bacteroidota bacterium]MBT3964395.1 M24 family metallopeptidase [Flavobacteriales bacterium]MBT4705829.1 M24 family metallopeptidase [Flavobacteriales bacterium]MBT4931607.1 M24 family metallopeptidase [Flavobacteriales bacterium]